jgi:ferrous iron transport protein B
MSTNIVLVGNPNSGKTTLFNQLTGSNQKVGNLPGVTIESKDGPVKGHKDARVVDLPGIYSLAPYSAEEVVARDYIIKQKPDVIINIVDATNIERNLYLTLQLLELETPIVVALNMMDAARNSGISIDIKQLSKILSVPVIPISASKNEGIHDLIGAAIETASRHSLPKKVDFCTGPIHNAIHSISHLIEDDAKRANLPLRYAATKAVEGDELIISELDLHQPDEDIIQHIVDDMEFHLNTDREAAMADMRYCFIEDLTKKVLTKTGVSKEHIRSLKIDDVLTHKYLALPIFFGIMLVIFWLTFGPLGTGLSELFETGIDKMAIITDRMLSGTNINPVFHSLIIDGVFVGVGSVMSFLPLITILFFLLSIMEDSGYVPRVAFFMDKLLRKLGLSGRSIVPLLLGFGCSVPAIMATRTLPSKRDRYLTILLVPFMSCSAKIPIYAMFTAAFFQGHKALVMFVLYLLGIIVAIVCALLLKNTIFIGNPVPFVMVLPNYRMPVLKSVLLRMWENVVGFIQRAFTIIFIATIIIWLLQSFDLGLNMVENSDQSILAKIGVLAVPIFAPLGFGDWRAATALITGLSAKEAVVSTFAILLGAPDAASLPSMMSEIFSPLTAFVFLVFSLLYMPCVATLAAARREMGSFWGAVATVTFQTAVAWIVSFIVYNFGSLILYFM